MYEITQYQDGTVVEYDGQEIARFSGEGYKKDEIAEAVLQDANFGTPQKEALRALIGTLNVDTIDEPMP